MQKNKGITDKILGGLYCCLRKCLFGILSVVPVPSHIAFIMDGNRRFEKKMNLAEGGGHRAGFLALLSIVRYCYELGVKYVSVYAFSIDNFRRNPKHVQYLMDLMREKIDELLEQESIINEYGVRLVFVGKLELLSEPVRAAMEKAMRVTAHNNQRVLIICVAYTSTDEIVHAVQESCKDKWNEVQSSKVANGSIARTDLSLNNNSIDLHFQDSNNSYLSAAKDCTSSVLEGVEGAKKHVSNYSEAEITTCNELVEITEESEYKENELPSVKLVDIEKNIYMAVAPDPDILIRTSGEVRLSNFLLWQTSICPLYSPTALWPEIGLRHLVWAVLNFQKHHSYLEKKKKQF
ncbi:hypothetical protein TanjilG_28225 [Lupinus angustifolius]|uniref:Alkyl transferase n=1 Tax=Lupinus angustifolius TaxID=3871 RepID=A0A4P1RF91_LUPAN|nr:PREDICTED: dehydrodolichyl diphosphate synthase 6-like [Lupinus angustifolius]OIW09626.1 hypothetical protein TanjilG_28225 [Lupinus angustifolius]